MKMVRLFFALAVALFLQAAPLSAQIPASELPPPGTDTGLDGKYDPENGIAQVIQDKKGESGAGRGWCASSTDRSLGLAPLLFRGGDISRRWGLRLARP
ncbi:MAG: hypothetical protein QOD99_883 [Chthoniobacter sp.]|jgi:hypothetical protein|nr:hypothetical protein [Chthoniobacter sp.]